MDLHELLEPLLAAKTEENFIIAHGLAAAWLGDNHKQPDFAAHIAEIYECMTADFVQTPDTAISRFDTMVKALERLRYVFPEFVLFATAGLAKAIRDIRSENPELARQLTDILTHEPAPERLSPSYA